MTLATPADLDTVAIEIGGIPISLRTTDLSFQRLLHDRYAGFLTRTAAPEFTFDVDLVPPGTFDPEDDVQVEASGGEWRMQRGDFRAEFNARLRRGRIRQSANPYSIDTVLRLVHTLVLAPQGGFLLHAASVVRHGRAFLFAGVSRAGKTTIARLAPPDATLLSDEISYVRPAADGYRAFGTPFSGELGRPGENIAAPIAGLYLLGKAEENRLEPVDPAASLRGVLQNILFFAEKSALAGEVFRSACAFVDRVPVQRLWFVPDARVWQLLP